jgi:hypothetical protein
VIREALDELQLEVTDAAWSLYSRDVHGSA